jgi:hypothetical protein
MACSSTQRWRTTNVLLSERARALIRPADRQVHLTLVYFRISEKTAVQQSDLHQMTHFLGHIWQIS